MHQFNVFSELVVTHPNETFEWVVNQSELPPGSTSVTISPTGSSWPLSASSYTVVPGTPTQATVNGRVQAGFQCSPAAPNVGSQTIVVACHTPFGLCDEVLVNRGDYFIWENDTANTVVITPDPSNADFWPLPAQSYTVQPHTRIHAQIPADAVRNKSYNLLVQTANGTGICAQQTQPKISVGSTGTE